MTNERIKNRSTIYTPNNTDKMKFMFLEKECKTKQKSIKEMESLLDTGSAQKYKVSSITTFLYDPCESNGFDLIINLEDLQRTFFLCEQENTLLKRLQKFEVPLQLMQLKDDRDVDFFK